jgi:hypothetical protein
MESHAGWWIDGVGSELGPLNTWLFEAQGNSVFLFCCEVGGNILFTALDFKEAITNISHTPIAVSVRNAIFDLQGRRIAGHPARGLYIMDGKKVLLTE